MSLLWRAIRLRCPNCGGGGLWRTWFRMREACPRCGLHLERGEQGYIVGAQMFNIIAAELLFAAIFLGVLVVTLPDAPWAVLQYGGPALMFVFPVCFYPFSKTIFLAFDLFFRPPTLAAQTQTDPPFLVTQLIVLALFVWLGRAALKGFAAETPAKAVGAETAVAGAR